MAYKQQPGRPQMAKTGRGIPKELMGPQMAGGPEFDFIGNVQRGVKEVGRRLSAAYNRAGYEYDASTRPADYWGSMGSSSGGGSGRSYAKNPVAAVTGFVKGLVTGRSTPGGAKMYKK